MYIYLQSYIHIRTDNNTRTFWLRELLHVLAVYQHPTRRTLKKLVILHINFDVFFFMIRFRIIVCFWGGEIRMIRLLQFGGSLKYTLLDHDL